MDSRKSSDLLESLPNWEIGSESEVPMLHRLYRFDDFTQALAFTNQVAALAEAEDHHPRIVMEWGSVQISWWTHVVRGLHYNDFIMAARCEDEFRR
jgi:4a-hydroxytetrahydrobiopterin dehydratase